MDGLSLILMDGLKDGHKVDILMDEWMDGIGLTLMEG